MWPFRRSERRSNPAPLVSLRDPAALSLLLGDDEPGAVNVTVEAALGVPAIWCAVNFVADTIAALPLHVYDARDKTRVRDGLAYILHDAANEETTSYEWRKVSFVNMLLLGRQLTFVERDRRGLVVALWPLDPGKATVERQDGRRVYIYREGTRTLTYRASEVIDCCYMPASDGIASHSPIRALRHSIGLTIALERYAARYFSHGGVPPLQLSGPLPTGEAARRAAEGVLEAVKALSRTGSSTLPLPSGYKLEPIGVDPAKGQMVEARRMQIEEVSRYFGLPPVFIHDLTHGTYANTEQQDLNFVKHRLLQLVKAHEQQLNLKLFGPGDRSRYVEYSLDGLLRGDFATRMGGMATAVQTAIMTPNEARRRENLPPLDGGDALLVQGATVPLAMQGALEAQDGQSRD